MGFTIPGFGLSEPKRKSNLEIFRLYEKRQAARKVLWDSFKKAKVGDFTPVAEPSEESGDERVKIDNHFTCGHSLWQDCDCKVTKQDKKSASH